MLKMAAESLTRPGAADACHKGRRACLVVREITVLVAVALVTVVVLVVAVAVVVALAMLPAVALAAASTSSLRRRCRGSWSSCWW